MLRGTQDRRPTAAIKRSALFKAVKAKGGLVAGVELTTREKFRRHLNSPMWQAFLLVLALCDITVLICESVINAEKLEVIYS